MESNVISYFRQLNDARRKSTLIDNLFEQTLRTINQNLGNIATGVILILVAERMKSGDFTVGDIALFMTYVGEVARSGSLLGTVMTHHARAQISFGRMEGIVDGVSSSALAQHSPVYLRGETPTVPVPVKSEADQLRELTVKGLTYRYEESENGIHEIDLQIFPRLLHRYYRTDWIWQIDLAAYPSRSPAEGVRRDSLEWRGGRRSQVVLGPAPFRLYPTSPTTFQ